MVDGRWYEEGLIYELSVRTFTDGNGDGIGDFRGLGSRLDYLAGLGVTALWLSPFYGSPWRDDGYDISDFYAVHPELGDLGDFVRVVERASDRGIRVLIDLVVNHTSDEHPWFQSARAGDPRFQDYYVWSKRRPADAASGVVFPGEQSTTWSYDRKARQYYFHRFYDFQPDLDIANPAVRDEIEKIIGFWAGLGIAGFRLDAVPFLIEPVSAADSAPGPCFDYLRQFRQYLSWRSGDAVLLGEANIEPAEIGDYFGKGGLHMLFDFIVNQHLCLPLAREDARPLAEALRETAGIPGSDQWAVFLRNHDELDLGRLAENERRDVFRRFGPRKSMQLYGRGIRRRLAPMLGRDRHLLELAFSLLLTLPGTPVLYYGDEIAMDDDLSQPERNSVRTPMEWSAVADQRRDPASLLGWLQRAIRLRKESSQLGTATWELLETRAPSVLALRYAGEDGPLVTLHNLANRPVRVSPRIDDPVDLLANRDYGKPGRTLRLDPYGYRWLRAESERRNR
ncbi:MAG: trehalose synthase [Actinobacteria bacterium]|nr:MAG: trehalose synthase [Actinomycetota bacterium]